MNIYLRLQFDAKENLSKLIQAYFIEDRVDIDCKMREHFQIAREKPEAFLNHPKVLGISIGGSNTKIILAETREGEFVVHHFKSVHNPSVMTPFYEYLDRVLKDDPVFWTYLTGAEKVCIGVSLPTLIVNGVPFHRTKVPTLQNLIARSDDEITSDLDFKTNLENYLTQYGIAKPTLYFNMDAIIAHFGSVSVMDVLPEERSLLFVCGTGLATADDNSDHVIGMLNILEEDDELYPISETENRQYQYAIAGKGIFGVMRRAIAIRSREMDSCLGAFQLEQCFQSPYDTKTVFEIWESTLPEGRLHGKAKAISKTVGLDVFWELQQLAIPIVSKAIQCMANCILASLAKLIKLEKGYKYHLIMEGSIVQNHFVLPRINASLVNLIEDEDFFRRLGINRPEILWKTERRMLAIPSNGADFRGLEQMDYTAIGACTSIMAENILNNLT